MTSSSNARPKRAADHFARTNHFDFDEPSAKKPRFDPRNPSTLAPDTEENDPVLDADEIGKRVGIKRNAVNIDGYDSDSSIENFDARADAKSKGAAAKAKTKADEDDEDMFAEEEEADPGGDGDYLRREGKKKKPVRFLEDHEIEGQEESSKGGGHVSADFGADSKSRIDEAESSSESGDDEERDRLDPEIDEELGAGSKKRHAPRLDAFNMKAEQEEGRFDEAGNYVRKAYDPDAAQDVWLDGISKKDMKRAKEAKVAQERRIAEQRDRQRKEDAIPTSDVLATMITYLGKGETPMEALLRYGKLTEKKTTKSYNRNKRAKAQDIEVDEDPSKKAARDKAIKVIEDITESANRLQDRGIENIYDEPRELIVRHYKHETGEEWKDPPRTWEYRWVVAPEQVHGPYDSQTMQAWQDRGSFEGGAEFRAVGDSEWVDEADF
ncbi:hypothetical protein CC78DRAFT_533700 [Lojkania enalia]|uniref:GYF domain-containing protein n=1 Tax=Lojkania enalia TaxID=147567 RepID=A0A9P4KD73_9PLEO|nr:hypothetical protein CC78DRAFT_533700 [Didymosphaeria enalia]